MSEKMDGTKPEPTDGDLLRELGMDVSKWATAFCQRTGFADGEWALTWFCNAIMAGYDEGRRREEMNLRQLVGWLSADIPELHRVSVPALWDSVERFKGRSESASEVEHGAP